VSPPPPGTAATTLGAFEITLPERSAAEAAALAGSVAGVLTHSVIAPSSVVGLERALTRSPHAASARLVDLSRITIGHHQRVDSVWAIDEEVAHDVATETDVGVDAAATEFNRALAGLESARIVDSATLDVAGAHRSRVMQGQGNSQGMQTERVKEYVFFAPRTINGVPIGEAGVRVSVHRSGKIASIRVAGAVVAASPDSSGLAAPTGQGHLLDRTVPESELDARVRADNPDAAVTPLGLLYWLPGNVRSAVVAPRQAYMVFPRVVIDGQTGPGRGHRALYAVDDATASPLLAPVPTPGGAGDPRP
jgi:hypothetical protein